MADHERMRFPTEAEARDLIGPGRLPYAMVSSTLFSAEGIAQNKMITQTIRALHHAQTDGVLEPPLSDPLADAIGRADSFINEHGYPEQGRGFNYDTGRILLSAVFEHGYQRVD